MIIYMIRVKSFGVGVWEAVAMYLVCWYMRKTDSRVR